MWKLHRYYLREVTINSVVTFLVLFGIVLVSLVYRGIRRAQGFGLLDALKITFYWAADTLPHLLPISLLFATVLTFARAAQDREITAIRAAGVSPRVVLTSALLVGIAFSLLGSFALHYLVPRAHFEKYRVLSHTIRTVILETGMLGDKFAFGGLVMTWDHKNARGRWEDVVIRIEERGGRFEDIGGEGMVVAEEAWIELSPDGEVLTLVLRGARNLGENAFFNEITRISISIRAITEEVRRDDEDRDLTTDQLLAEVYRGVHDNPHAARYTVHRRACFALLPCLFAPLGFCIGVLARERGRMLALVFSMAPVFLFYLSDFFGAKLVRAWDWPTLAWFPAIVLFVLGLPFCWRLLRF